MPLEIQARISQTIDGAIDTRIRPLITAVNDDVAAFSVSQANSTELVQSILNVGKETRIKGQEAIASMGNKLDTVITSQKTHTERIVHTVRDQSQAILGTIINEVQQTGKSFHNYSDQARGSFDCSITVY
jgi:hypothetical protein